MIPFLKSNIPLLLLLSFYVFRGLKYVSKFRSQRLRAIAERLARDGDHYDIVALQEIWVEEDFEMLKTVTGSQFRYRKYFYSGILSGPGLLVLSKWPIESAYMLRYPLNGRPSAFYRGDWFVGKSAASVVIRPPASASGAPSRPIELISTHLHAPYGPGDAAYTCHRTAQAWELARLAKRASEMGHAVIVLGDLNSIPGSLSHRLFQHTGGLRDTWQDIHGEFEGGPEAMGILSPEDQIVLAGTTCDSQLNTWRATRQRHEAKRLDYIFYDPKHARPIASRVSFIEPIPGIGSVSDHFAVEADLAIFPRTDFGGAAGTSEITHSTPSYALEGSSSTYPEQPSPATLRTNGSTKTGFHTHNNSAPSSEDSLPLGSNSESIVNSSSHQRTQHTSNSTLAPQTTPVTTGYGASSVTSHTTVTGTSNTRDLNQRQGQDQNQNQQSFGSSSSSSNNKGSNFDTTTAEDLRLLYTDILDLIEDYKPTSIMQSKLRNYHFWASVFILIAMLISVWWGAAHNRAYVGFIFLLLTIVISITGLLDGLMGFLFGRNEWRALLEFESEVELARHFLS